MSANTARTNKNYDPVSPVYAFARAGLKDTRWFTLHTGREMGVHVPSPVDEALIGMNLRAAGIDFSVRTSSSVCHDKIISVKDAEIFKLMNLLPNIRHEMDENTHVIIQQKRRRTRAARDVLNDIKSAHNITLKQRPVIAFVEDQIGAEKFTSLTRAMRTLGIDFMPVQRTNGTQAALIINKEDQNKYAEALMKSDLRAQARPTEESRISSLTQSFRETMNRWLGVAVVSTTMALSIPEKVKPVSMAAIRASAPAPGL